MKPLTLLLLFFSSLLAWEPITKIDNNTSLLQNFSITDTISYVAKHQHYSDKLLYFLDSRSFKILGKLYEMENPLSENKYIYQSLLTDTYYIAQGSPITENNPFGWKKIENPSPKKNFIGYMLFIDFPKDPKRYRAYSWALVNPDLKSFKKLIGADPKGGFRWYVDEGWKKRVVIKKEDNIITFKTRGISVPLLPEQEGYYFGYQTFSGKWENIEIIITNTLTNKNYSYQDKLYPIFFSEQFSTDIGFCLDIYYIIIENKLYSFKPDLNERSDRGASIIGYIDGCPVISFPNGEKKIWCKTDNAIGESPIQKDPYRGEITTDTSRIPKPTTEHKKCWE